MKRDVKGGKEGKHEDIVCVRVCVLLTGGRIEGGTYRFWLAALCLVPEAMWSLQKWGPRLIPGPHTL